MGDIKKLDQEKRFPVDGELYRRITELIHEYDGEIGVASAIGVLELVKMGLIEDV